MEQINGMAAEMMEQRRHAAARGQLKPAQRWQAG